MLAVIHRLNHLLDQLRFADGIAPLLLRLYLAPVMLQAGWTKLMSFDDTAEWFGNSDWGLGLPFPEVTAHWPASWSCRQSPANRFPNAPSAPRSA